MKILIVGARGFVARNLIATLENIITKKDKSFQLSKTLSIYKYSRNMGVSKLREFCRDCDFIFYLSGVNRTERVEEFEEGNVSLLRVIIEELSYQHNFCPIVYASSTQASMDNEYGKSKRRGEELLNKYSREKNALIYIYRLTNIFGKWSKPNYNSVVATFCYNIAQGLPIKIDAPNRKLRLIYIDDVVEEFIRLLEKKERTVDNPIYIKNVYEITLKELADLIYELKECGPNRQLPDIKEKSFNQRLYSMYLTYVPKEQLKYSLTMNLDERGSFTEIFRMDKGGQISVNIAKPGVVKGEHWHHTKHEKFVVVSGKGVVRLRKIDDNEILNFHVSGKQLEVIDIPAGYTHNIENEGTDDLVTLMWANERFRIEKPDTYFLKVDDEKED